MSYDYNAYVTFLSSMLVVDPTNADFITMLPQFIDAAEQGIYRDLDLLDTVIRDSTANFTPDSRNFALPTTIGKFNIVNGINVITPNGFTIASGGSRVQLIPTSRDFIDATWGAEPALSVGSTPGYFAPITSQSYIVGPPPGAAFQAEVIGTTRPITLSAANPTTILTTNLPDLFLAASMKFGAAYLKNFGAAADDPRSATTWTTTYEKLIQSASVEEFRKKFAASAWSSILPSPMAQPPRT